MAFIFSSPVLQVSSIPLMLMIRLTHHCPNLRSIPSLHPPLESQPSFSTDGLCSLLKASCTY
jgi:hypothetical protein